MDKVKQFITDMRNLGIKPDDTLLVHSSLKSLGWVEGGADTVVRTLIESLPEGTLMMPALSWHAVNKANPIFSVLNTPSCVGTIPEAFRKYPGVYRSINPVHSVCAYGKNAEKITSYHHIDRTPVGKNSPFRLLVTYRGKIMMLGCGLEPNTFMHGVEEAANLPYVLEDKPTRIVIEDHNGNKSEALYYMHDFQGIIQRYDRVSECYNLKSGKLLEADVFIMDAFDLWKAASNKISKEPWFFVDRQ